MRFRNGIYYTGDPSAGGTGFSAHTIFCHRSFVGSNRDNGGLYADHRKEIPKKIIKV